MCVCPPVTLTDVGGVYVLSIEAPKKGVVDWITFICKCFCFLQLI